MGASESLARAALGESVRVAGIAGGQEVRSRLASLGLLPGVLVQVVTRAPLGGPVLIDVGGTRVAIGRKVAQKVLVQR
ncbi:MAG: ferrous iron transport protein A [Acidobacteria bacterium]|nr:ferrous iron transport protein A [Acidobacteriota bacterium]